MAFIIKFGKLYILLLMVVFTSTACDTPSPVPINNQAPAENTKDIKIDTPLGTILGQTVDRKEDIVAFKGLPYALPPIGQRRWAPPEMAGNWSGPRIAKNYSPACMQQLISAESTRPRILGQQSEDCLYLNVLY